MTEDMPKTEPKMPIYPDRFSSGMISVMRVINETIRPAAAKPVTARPRMRRSMLGAVAQRSDPTSKTIMDERKIFL